LPAFFRTSNDRPHGCDRGNRSAPDRQRAGRSDAKHASRTIRPLERLRYTSARPTAGHSPNRASSRGVPDPTAAKRGLAGRRRSSLVRRPTALLGFNALRRFAPAGGWTLHPASQATRLKGRSDVRGDSELTFCSASLPVRAHVPFVPRASPRLIFVGVTDRLLEKRDLQKRSAGMRGGVDFWASLPSAVRPRRQLVGPGARSCLGLCLLQGCRALCRASARARPRRPIIRPRNPRGQRVSPRPIPIRSWDSRRSIRITTRASSCSAFVT
jgi:hypothetical protein